MPANAPRFRHAAIVGKPGAQRELQDEVARFVAEQGLRIATDRQAAEFGRECDLAIVVGGDGTMLGIARELARFDIPLIGINQGRLGFITDIAADRWRDALGPMLAGEVEEEQRTMIDAGVWRDGACIFQGLSMNDVVVSRGATAGMVELRVDIGEEFVANMRADGLIVASPTGSTAYALSAGGPILHPGIAGWLLVPIASHTLSNRPIVLPDTGEVRITVVAGRDASANFDMQGLASLQHGDQVRMRRSAQRVRFLHPKGWSYYATLRRKLRWYEGVV